MAKQTFTVGQVLTADQMTSLQQTAMGGGSATAKTASYTLVAADAGTTVIMNSASSTTITVNTSLFAAGDTVFIVNQGAGVCTITAGTATVSTAGALAMSQNETGELYFLSTSAAIFSQYTQTAGATGGMTSIASGSLPTGSGTLTLSGIVATYNNLQLVIRDHYPATDTSFRITVNNDTTANVYNQNWTAQSLTTSTSAAGRNAYVYLGAQYDCDASNARNALTLNLYDYTNTTAAKLGDYVTGYLQAAGVDFVTERGMFMWNASTTAAINRIDFMASSGNFSGGTYILYGVK